VRLVEVSESVEKTGPSSLKTDLSMVGEKSPFSPHIWRKGMIQPQRTQNGKKITKQLTNRHMAFMLARVRV